MYSNVFTVLHVSWEQEEIANIKTPESYEEKAKKTHFECIQ